MKEKRLGIFIFYDKDGIADDYVFYMLSDLKKVLSKLVVVVNGNVTKDSLEKFKKYTNKIYKRDNVGFDIAGFKMAITDYLGWQEIYKFDEIVLLNDTVFGPIYPYENVFSEMKNRKGLDFWGMTCYWHKPNTWANSPNHDQPTHIQSYFVVVRKNMLHSTTFREYWDNQPLYTTYRDVVGRHELVFTQYFEMAGFKWDTYVDLRSRKQIDDRNNYNIISTEPFQLVSKLKSPIFKIKPFSYPLKESLSLDRSNEQWKLLEYLRDNTNYPVEYIWQHILRKYDITEIYYALGLDFVVNDRAREKRGYEKEFVFVIKLQHDEYIYFLEEVLKKAISICKMVIIIDEKNVKVEEVNRVLDGHGVKTASVYDMGVNVEKVLDEIEQYQYVTFLYDYKNPLQKTITTKNYYEVVIDNILPAKHDVSGVLECFKKNSRLGMLFPPVPFTGEHTAFIGNVLMSSEEKTFTNMVIGRMNLSVPVSQNGEYNYISFGCSFWCRSAMFAEMLKKLEFLKYDVKPMKLLGKTLPYIASGLGFYVGTVMSSRDAAVEMRNSKWMLNRLVQTYKYSRKEFPGINLYNFRQQDGKTTKLNQNSGQYDHYFPHHLFPKKERIVIYGAGNIGQEFYRQAKDIEEIDVAGIVDKNSKNIHLADINVKSIEDLKTMEFDSILISIHDRNVAASVKKMLIAMGYEEDKIKWDGDVYYRKDFWRWYRGNVKSMYSIS